MVTVGQLTLTRHHTRSLARAAHPQQHTVFSLPQPPGPRLLSLARDTRQPRVCLGLAVVLFPGVLEAETIQDAASFAHGHPRQRPLCVFAA